MGVPLGDTQGCCSSLARQAKILREEAEENKLGKKALGERWKRWHTCSLCEQDYHGVVKCALGWACWKTYLGRPEGNGAYRSAMCSVGNGLYSAEHYADALSVMEAELAMKRRIGAPENCILTVQGNIANSYQMLGRLEDALRVRREIYAQRLKLSGEEHPDTIRVAICYAMELIDSRRFRDAKALTCKALPVARRVLGNTHEYTFMLRSIYAEAIYKDDAASLDDLRETVRKLEDVEQTARRVLGGAHPSVASIELSLRDARAALAARETPRA